MPITQSISVKAPADSEVKAVLVNGKLVKVSSKDPSNVTLPVIIGPKDKVTMEVKLADGSVVSVPITPSPSSFDIANVNFDTSAYSLSAAAKKILDNVANTVKAHGFTVIDLTGHTDTAGVTSGYDNQALSYNRAVATRTYLLNQLKGYKVTIKIAAKAQVDPVAENATQIGRAINRRVEVAVH